MIHVQITQLALDQIAHNDAADKVHVTCAVPAYVMYCTGAPGLALRQLDVPLLTAALHGGWGRAGVLLG